MNERPEISVHPAHVTPYHPRETPPAPQFDNLPEFFLGKRVPLPALDHPDGQPRIKSYVVDRVVGHKLGPGWKSLHNFKCRMRLRGYGLEIISRVSRRRGTTVSSIHSRAQKKKKWFIRRVSRKHHVPPRQKSGNEKMVGIEYKQQHTSAPSQNSK